METSEQIEYIIRFYLFPLVSFALFLLFWTVITEITCFEKKVKCSRRKRGNLLQWCYMLGAISLLEKRNIRFLFYFYGNFTPLFRELATSARGWAWQKQNFRNTGRNDLLLAAFRTFCSHRYSRQPHVIKCVIHSKKDQRPTYTISLLTFCMRSVVFPFASGASQRSVSIVSVAKRHPKAKTSSASTMQSRHSLNA